MPTSRPKHASVLPPPGLDCYRVEPHAPPLMPGGSKRDWMDQTTQRFAYRCTPMTVANASGWELRCPFAFDAEWDGGAGVEAITVFSRAGREAIERLIVSHFGHGVLTFHPGWLFRTPPGWALVARGPPNVIKDGITALEGLVETDWLPFTFTMNWRFTRPGRIRFAEDEAFCFLALVPHGVLDAVQPVAHELADDSGLAADYRRWQDSRSDFNSRLRQNDADAVREGWQRDYVRADGATGPTTHITKRKLQVPSPRTG
ncbi:DUF6065 family protein [Sphingomonas bacterium]|uniref:DUF6065 family protein n=1 Tax=Sphingomonas bacterium TaxID=1895847 RepID=UPI00157588A6|nr:DUF6065 family protein [Sphingomonas bacterium]